MSKVKMADFIQDDYALDGYAPRWIVSKFGTEEAAVKTEYGFVSASRITDNWEHTRLEFVWNGRLYQRTWRRTWGRRTISRLAREFAEDVVEQSLHQGIESEQVRVVVGSAYKQFAHLDHLLSSPERMLDGSPFHKTAFDLWQALKRVRQLVE